MAGLVAGGCGGSGALSPATQPGSTDTPGGPLPGGDPSPAADIVREVGGYTVTVLGESFSLGGSIENVTLSVDDSASEPELAIGVSGAQGLKSLYCEIAYDADRLDPQTVEPTDALGRPFNVGLAGAEVEGQPVLHLAVLNRRGVVHFGAVLARPQGEAGFSGDAVLARAAFARQPFTEQPVRNSSAAPTTDGSQAPFNYTSAENLATWYYANQGDYDQNSETNIADLTPLALHFGEVGPAENDGKFYGVDVRSIIDGDGNGEINIGDITPIGLNFSSKVAGFNVYMGSPGDYPASNSAESTAPAVGQVLFGDGSVREGESRLRYSLDVTADESSTVYWVRPFDGAEGAPGYEGTPSEKDGDEVAIIAPNVKIIDGNKDDAAYDSEFEYLGDDGQLFVILDPPGGQTIELNDVIVGFTYDEGTGLPVGGFLRRVIGINPLGGDQLEVDTSDEAGLGDIFLKGGLIKHGLDMGESQITDFTPLLPKSGCSLAEAAGGKAVTKKASAGLIDFNVDGAVIVNERDGDNYFTVTLPQANLFFGAGIDVDADFDKFLGIPYDLNWFQIIAQGGLASNLELVVDGHWFESLDSESLLFNARKDYFFVVFGVPVLLTFRLDVYGGTEGQAGFDMFARTGYNLDYTVKLGVKYHEDHGWSLVNEINDTFAPIPPELRVSGELDIKVYLRPEFSVALYGALGGGMKIKPYAYGHLDGNYELSAGPFCANWELGGGFSADMNVYGKIFGISLFDKSWNLYDGQFELTSGQIGCVEGPTPPIAEFYPWNYWTTTLPHEVTITAEYTPPAPPFPAGGSYDPDGGSAERPSGIKTYAWDLYSDGVIDFCGPDPVIYHTFDAKYEPISVTLYVTDEEGMVSAVTHNVQAEDPIG